MNKLEIFRQFRRHRRVSIWFQFGWNRSNNEQEKIYIFPSAIRSLFLFCSFEPFTGTHTHTLTRGTWNRKSWNHFGEVFPVLCQMLVCVCVSCKRERYKEKRKILSRWMRFGYNTKDLCRFHRYARLSIYTFISSCVATFEFRENPAADAGYLLPWQWGGSRIMGNRGEERISFVPFEIDCKRNDEFHSLLLAK